MQQPDRARERTIVAATFGALAGALLLGLYARRWLPAMPDGLAFALYLGGGLLPIALALRVVHRLPWRELPRELGFDRSPWTGLGAALLLTAPMVLGFALLEPGLRLEPTELAVVRQRPFAFVEAWAGAGLVEETLFRGFLFRQLVRRANWSDGRAMAACGLLFGLLHIPANRGAPAGELAAAAAITAVGGAAFCWFLREWDWTLWFVIGWHAFVNLWWMAGDGGGTTGHPRANALRLLVVALTVGVTMNRRRLPTWLGGRGSERADDAGGNGSES